MQSQIETKYSKMSLRKAYLTFFHSCLAFSREGRQSVSHRVLTRANNDSPSSNLKCLILMQKLLLGNPMDFFDLNINEKHRTCVMNISAQ